MGSTIRGKEAALIAEAVGNIDGRVLARIKAPFAHESFPETFKDGRVLTRYRIHDANDDALCSSYDKVYADFIVAALNAYKPR